jgi:type I restriction enzyme S subunit
VSWKIMKLADICEIKLGKTPSRSEKSYWDSDKKSSNIWVSIADLTKLNSRFIADSKEYITDKGATLFNPVKAGTLLMSFKLSIGKLAYANCDLYTNEAIVALPIKDKKLVDSDFLFYYLQSYDWDKETENDVKLKGKTLNKAKLKEIKVPLPLLATQQKIVAKLDAIFAEIDKATAATEANAKNAEALFQSYLRKIFTENQDWTITSLGNCFELYQPKTITTKDLIEDGQYEVYGANGVIGRYNKYNHEESQLLVTCRGATCGAVNVSSPYSWINGNAMVVKPKTNNISLKFTEYFFRGAVDLSKAITGAAQPQITRQSLSPVSFSYPSKDIQLNIEKELDSISDEIEKLIKSYKDKSKNLSILKGSILKQAFAGELVKE